MLPRVCAWITVITFTKIYWILPMHSNVTVKNVSWSQFSWATLYLLTYLTRKVVFGIPVSIPVNSRSFGHCVAIHLRRRPPSVQLSQVSFPSFLPNHRLQFRRLYTESGEKGATLSSTISPTILCRFLSYLHSWKQEWTFHNRMLFTHLIAW